jgi:glutathione synthase/RimK-type ligase-like ATP-grasp enzyme
MKISLLCTEATRFSASLKLLAGALTERLGYKVLRTRKTSPRRLQLRYGHSVNKIHQYQWFKEQGLSALTFSTDQDEVFDWLEKGNTVFGRRLLNSSCGKGIIVMENPNEYVVCPVYTLYKKKKREFRVHVFKDTIVSVVEKRKKTGWTDQRDTKVRNLANGYIFCQQVENEPAGLRELALAAAKVSPSDFRGVDIGYNERNDELFIIEVNSAPGITGTNIRKYVEGITQNV